MAYKLVERCVMKVRKDDVEWSYDSEIRKFAINLLFYSAKAYTYVRVLFYMICCRVCKPLETGSKKLLHLLDSANEVCSF